MQPPIRITEVGIHYRHEADFEIDRPAGLGAYAFVLFHSPMRLRLRRRRIACPAGSCILFSPAAAYRYRGAEGGFDNSWCHLAEEGVAGALRRYRLCADRVYRPAGGEFVLPLLHEMDLERRRGAPLREEACALLFERLLLQLRRETAAPATRFSARKRELFEIFRAVRLRVHSALEASWTVEAMAEEANLSVSRFAVLHREFFGVPPLEDLLRARLGRARWLLRHTTRTVEAVGLACGFPNVHYFSRLFRRRIGCPPGHYRAGGEFLDENKRCAFDHMAQAGKRRAFDH